MDDVDRRPGGLGRSGSSPAGVEVDDLLGNAPDLVEALGDLPVEVATNVVVVRPDAESTDPAESWIVGALSSLIAYLGELVGPAVGGLPEARQRSIVIALDFASGAAERQPVYCEAVAEGARGIVQSLVAERGDELRCNLVVATDAERADLLDFAAFVGSEGGRFMSGSHVDLRGGGF